MAAFQVFLYGRFWVFTEVEIQKLSSYGRTGKIKRVSLDINRSTGTRDSAQNKAPAIVTLLRLGHCRGRGTISSKTTYHLVWNLNNDSILEQLNVWRCSVTSC